MFIRNKSTLQDILPNLQNGDEEYETILIKDQNHSIKNALYFGPAKENNLNPWLNRIVEGLKILPHYVEIQLSNKAIVTE